MSEKENSAEEEFGEGEEEGEGLHDAGEGKMLDLVSLRDEGFRGEQLEKEWGPSGEYGEGGYFVYKPAGEAEGELSLWEAGSVKESGESEAESEVEETEEEKELKRERELLIEELKQKFMERLLLRRRNAFLQKKLVEHYKKRRMENVLKEDTKGLDLDSKYLKRLFAFQEFKIAQENEIRDLNEKMEQYEKETKTLKEGLDEKLKNFMARAKDVSLNLILSKTGKKLSEKAVDCLLRRYVQKNMEKGKKKLSYIKVKNEIEEKEEQLRAMEYIGDGLHLVDYEQMKIDNQNYTDKIEEKEDELTKMRMKTQTIIQNLAQVREKAYAIEGDIELMEEKVFDVETKFAKIRERLTLARKRRDFLREECTRLKASSGLLTRDRLLRDFEASIYEEKNLTKNLIRMKKLIQEKRKQEHELSKLVVTSASDFILPLELKISRSQRLVSE